MNKQTGTVLLAFVIAIMFFSGCGTPVPDIPANPENPQTLAAQTWSAMQTSAALTASPTSPPSIATNTQLPGASPTFTSTPTPTQTPVPLLTAIPTLTLQPTWTATSIPTATRWYYYPGGGVIPPPQKPWTTPVNTKPCLAAEFVRDITIPNGTTLPKDTDFVKVWRIANTGTCTWDTKLFFAPVGYVGGSPRNDPFGGKPVQIDEKVKPGKTIDIAVPLTTPDRDGSYKGQWVFTDKDVVFGNKGTNKAFVVNVTVQQTDKNPVYDFASNACEANWSSNVRWIKNQPRLVEGTSSLPCNGKPNNPVGFIRRVSEPNTEAGPATGLAGIWENPPFVKDGITQGAFPALLILPGDRFVAYVGCLFENNECNVTFTLKYRVIKVPYEIVKESSFTRDQVYDGAIGSLEVDLGDLGLAGKYVEFVFSVQANNDSKLNGAVWISPTIAH